MNHSTSSPISNPTELPPIPIVYHDAQLVVADKPSGLLTQPGLGPDKLDCLLHRLQHQYAAARIVHRLDRDTSGLIVLALDADTHRFLSRQFHDRLVGKLYAALVAGAVEGEAGRIDLPLRKDFDHPPRHCVDRVAGKPAVTDWHVLERFADRTRLQLEPRTGRSHQLRVHLMSIGHPILGDPLYARPAVQALSPRLALHASMLAFRHPATDRDMSFESPAPF
ncbi:MAG: RluA family pseudouridine synthase [Planctomycetes bacterium]|nr:RluA family pseudouridine synthase [Planctomycetota bacterium]